MTDALFLRQRVTPGEEDAVRQLVAEQSADRDDAVPEALVGGGGPVDGGPVGSGGVLTASLFLDRTRAERPGLVWYLEVEDAERGPWADPVSTLVRTAPLFEAGLGELLETPDSARVYSADSTAAAVLVHATLPDRPSSVAATANPTSATASSEDATPATPSPEGATGPTPDVVLFRLKVKSGVGERFLRALAGLTSRLDDEGRIERTFDEWSRPVLEAERMWTETISLERTDGDYYLWWYMETEDLDAAYDAYFETSNPVARVSERVIGTILADPGRALSNPAASSNYELLAHAASPDRR